MADVQFADILFILLVCGVIFAILILVSRSNKKNLTQNAASKAENNEGNSEASAEED